MHPPRSSREGFTLVELLVAVVILSTGILGLVANAALVSRLVGDGSRLTVAATVATARFEQLRAVPCTGIRSGAAVTRGIEERWTVTPIEGTGLHALQAQLSVTYRVREARGGRPRTQGFNGAVPCR